MNKYVLRIREYLPFHNIDIVIDTYVLLETKDHRYDFEEVYGIVILGRIIEKGGHAGFGIFSDNLRPFIQCRKALLDVQIF